MKTRQPRPAAGDPIARETGFVRKPHGGRLRVALAFPNSYHVGMSNLGFQTAYRIFNAIDEVVCERAFMPPRQRPGERVGGGEPLRTLESGTPVCDFDVLAFSVSFEWDYTNVVALLRLAGLPARAEHRDNRHPLVMVGGAITFLNPEPLAPFADVVAVGEGEVLIPSFIKAVAASTGRRDLLTRLALTHGFYVPSFVEPLLGPGSGVDGFAPRPGLGFQLPLPIQKAALPSSAATQPPSTMIFTPDTEFGSRLLIEVVRGCANLCRFCWAGYNYLPVRPFETSAILRRAEEARPHARSAGLVSIALCDHPDIEEILRRLREMGYGLSPASLRLDDLTEPVIRELAASGERTITVAPEAGSDRLRRTLNKGFTNERILECADLVFRAGFENLKLYFMIGLPTEVDDDLVAIRDLTVAVRDLMLSHARRRGRAGRIIASVNPFIPKPGTAWQWLPMARPEELDQKTRRLRALVADLDNVHVTIKSERHSYYQALLSVGDRRVADLIEAAERNGGHWRAAAAETGVDTDGYVLRDRRQDAALPWDIIECGVPAAFLREELARTGRGELTGRARRP